jgi:hypothetical protein
MGGVRGWLWRLIGVVLALLGWPWDAMGSWWAWRHA